MIVIAGSLTFDEADRKDVIASLTDVTEHSRRDPGCIEYHWSEDLEARNTFLFFECWETQELFDEHIAAPHEKEFGERNLSRMKSATARIFSATEVS